VNARLGAAVDYLGLTADLDRPARLDLAGRALDCIASPGHDAAAVTFYDAYTGLLLTATPSTLAAFTSRTGLRSVRPLTG
jgi:hydroxyacylglutathione hydrolase